MPGRRTYGTGSISFRDGRWCGRIDLGRRPDGKRDRPAVYGQTKQEVARKLAALRRQHEAGQRPRPDGETVGEWLSLWLETIQRPRVAPSTYERHRGIVSNYLLPAFGSLRLAALKPEHIQAAYATWPVQPSTIRLNHRVLAQALELAVRWGKLPRNPARVVVLPKLPPRQATVLDEAAAERFLTAARGDPWEALFVVALATGLRIGELLALRWAAVDLDAATLRVERKLLYVGRQLIEDAPKTPAAVRTVPLLPLAVSTLRAHRQRQREERLRAPAWPRPDLVFPSVHGQAQHAHAIVEVHLPRLLARAGLPRMKVHDLRRSAATLWLKRGAPVEVVARLLGHASPSTTLAIYRSILPGEERRAVETVGDLFAEHMDTEMDAPGAGLAD
jgi:integrase